MCRGKRQLTCGGRKHAGGKESSFQHVAGKGPVQVENSWEKESRDETRDERIFTDAA